ncbi:MAG: hypothetical protein QM764_21880 [Chitinophagaceae bacterium]
MNGANGYAIAEVLLPNVMYESIRWRKQTNQEPFCLTDNFMKFISFVSLIFLIACNFEVNTTDPQASISIETSKADHFFKKEYTVINDSGCVIHEAWIEETWKIKIENGSVVKKGLSTHQLILQVDSLPPEITYDNYVVKWQLEDSMYGILGSANGVYIMDLREGEFPKSFTIIGHERNNPAKVFCKIYLKEEN